MLRFNDIADRMLEYNPGIDLELLQRAYVFSAKVHEGQERLSGEPYLIHPLEVAGLLVDMRVDDVTVVAGLLHDTLEDTLTTREEIERLFGAQVAFLVEGLTKIAKIEFTSARERQAESFRKMLIAMSKDIRILLIKLADRLHNMRTLGYMSDAAQKRIAQETLDIYAPLAHRLGIHWMKQELEDLAFRTLHRERAEELERQLKVSFERRSEYVEEVAGVLSTKLVASGLQAEVTGRLKDLSSIHHKMESLGVGIDEIYDVIAFRVVLEGGTDACYAALGVVHNIWRPVPNRFKDYVALPKANGYQSLHTTVIGPYGERMEVQLRNAEMHRAAELGIAAHWKYKQGRIDSVGDEDVKKFAWLREMLDWQQYVADPHEFLDTVKVDLFPDEVFVFTPRGDVISLPRRACPVDFAYAIHSEVGDQCAGARVNGKMVPLRHPLTDGDTVEVITSKHQFPRKDWLDFVVTGKARNRIRNKVRQSTKDRSRQLGRDILERELRKSNLRLKDLEKGGELAELAEGVGRGGVDELFAAIGFGRLSAESLVRKLTGDEEPAPARSLRSLFRRPRRPESGPGIRVSGLPDVMVRFGGCCSPVPGDEIIGFVTRGRGVTVHSRECKHAFEAAPERRIDVDWDDEVSLPRKVTVCVRTKDHPGILAQITNSISAAKINIGNARITTDEGKPATQNFDLWVPDLQTLEDVMEKIRRVKGVLSVDRVRG